MALVKTAQIDNFNMGATTEAHADPETLIVAARAAAASSDMRDTIVSVQWERRKEHLDITTYADSGRNRENGLEDGSLTVTTLPDHSDGVATFDGYVESDLDRKFVAYLRYGEDGVDKEMCFVGKYQRHRSSEDAQRRRTIEWQFESSAQTGPFEQDAPSG